MIPLNPMNIDGLTAQQWIVLRTMFENGVFGGNEEQQALGALQDMINAVVRSNRAGRADGATI